MNVGKTESVAVSDSPLTLKYKYKAIEQVNELMCLGSLIDHTWEKNSKIKKKIGQATSALNKLKPSRYSKKYSMRLKLRLMNGKVMSILLYPS